jgi:hypothetical protein
MSISFSRSQSIFRKHWVYAEICLDLRRLDYCHRSQNHLRRKVIHHEDNASLIKPENFDLINVLTKYHSTFCYTDI